MLHHTMVWPLAAGGTKEAKVKEHVCLQYFTQLLPNLPILFPLPKKNIQFFNVYLVNKRLDYFTEIATSAPTHNFHSTQAPSLPAYEFLKIVASFQS